MSTESSLNHPTVFTQIGVVPAAFFYFWSHSFVSKIITELLRLISRVTAQGIRTFARASFPRTKTIAVKASRLGIGGRAWDPSLTLFRLIRNLLVPYEYRIPLGFCGCS